MASNSRTLGKTPDSNRGFDVKFFNSLPYYNAYYTDDCVASIDNIRIKFVYPEQFYNHFEKRSENSLEHLLHELTNLQQWMPGAFDCRFFERSFKIGAYRFTVNYFLPDGSSFAVLLGRHCYDASCKGLSSEAILDFNPNKVDPNIWQWVLRTLSSLASGRQIQRFDLALDFPIRRDLLELQRRPGSQYHKLIDKHDVITEYTGKRSHHAAIKLYDKRAEAHLDFDCTRCEITIEKANFTSVADLWPRIVSAMPLQSSFEMADLRPEAVSCILHPDLIPVFKTSCCRQTWKKIQDQIDSFGGTYLTLMPSTTADIDLYINNYLQTILEA